MSLLSSIWNPVKKYFLSGVLVVVPIILTYLVLRLLFNAVDSILQPLILELFGVNIPGLGIIATLVLVLVVGLVTRNLIGSQMVEIWDGLMEKMPVIRPIYSASKQLMEAMTSAGAGSFKEVALIEYPRKGVYAIGLVAQRIKLDIPIPEQEMVAVFVPSTPTPMSGMTVMVPASEVIWLEMSVEAALGYIVSGGVAVPRMIESRATSNRPAEEPKP